MKEERLKKIIKDIKDGKLSEDKALENLKKLPYLDMGYARVDLHREIRTGYPEVVFAEGKTALQIQEISRRIYENHGSVLVTRLDGQKYDQIKDPIPGHRYSPEGRILYAGEYPAACGAPVPVITAGTADLPVAEEAAWTLAAKGCSVKKIYDAGVSGVHRMLSSLDELEDSNVIIVIAGMDGVLPSVVGGCVKQPVIAVPTSTGYGAGAGGIAPLLTMLNSCAPGVVVVNIDNGFGAACAAASINSLAAGKEESS